MSTHPDPHGQPLTGDSLACAIQLIEGRTGLAVSSLLRADFGHIAQRLAYGSPAMWLQELQASREDDEPWQRLLGALTIGETYFMRDPQQFRLLKERLLPPLVLKRRQAGQLDLNILCVGCSTGEEAYSIAITLNEFLPDLDRWTLTLYGMDINSAALQAAQRATYRPWSFRHVNETFLRRYFVPAEDGYQLRDEIARRVTFLRGNLITPPTLPTFDIVLCRNILLYFTARHARVAEDNLYRLLRPGGWLILGSAEALRSQRERWQIDPHFNTPIYQKARRRPTQPLTHPQRGAPPPAAPAALVAAAEVGDAEAALRHGDNDHAERLLGQILLESPHDPRCRTLLAHLFASRKAYPEARSHLGAALHTDPTYADAYYLRAVMLHEEGADALALKELQAALYYERDHLLSLVLLGRLLQGRGDLPRAHKAWARARGLLHTMPPGTPLSALTELTAAQMLHLLEHQLDE